MAERRGSDTRRVTQAATDRRQIWRDVQEAHAALRGEHQIAEYVAALDIGECARILASDPEGLSRLAALRDECRVAREESRTFEQVIRTWTLEVLSGAEGG